MISSNDRERRSRQAMAVLWLATAALAAGCTSELTPAGQGPIRAPMEAGIAVSSSDGRPGDTVGVLPLVRRTDGGPLIGTQGRLHFDPSALRYLGQPLEGAAFVLVNRQRAAAGELRVASLGRLRLNDASADLRFVVLRAGWASGLRYDLEEAATPEAIPLYRYDPLVTAEWPASRTSDVRPRDFAAWAEYLGQRDTVRPHLAGDGQVYGDANLSGTVTFFDAGQVANVAVGNLPLLTEANRDYVIAANVSPANLPGLGEADDPIPPGQNTDGSFSITIVDAAEIANEAVGNDRAVPGEPIPGRAPRPGTAVLAGPINTSRTLYRDTVYQLQGTVLVGPGATLTVEAGTRIEGDNATRGALVVARAGNISLRGTRIEPIVFTCKGAVKVPGCWGGIVLNGLALLNHSDPGTSGFCPEKYSIGTTELYGGCLVEDTSGVIQYTRIEYAGMSAGSGPVAGLSLLGVGTGTVLDHFQVHGSAGDGLYISGGNVNLRQIVLSGNLGVGIHWDHGWGGNSFGASGQFLQIQVPENGADAILGSNLVGAPNTLPRSAPELYNVTVVGSQVGAGRGYVLQDGSSGTLRNAVLMSTAAEGFDVEGPDACALFGAGLAFFDHAIVFGATPEYSTDADCLDEAAYAGSPSLFNRTVDPGLVAPANTLTPDTRPVPGGAATTGAVAPPSNLFFDVTVTYLGATEPADAIRTNVPWYAGWSRGWSGPTP